MAPLASKRTLLSVKGTTLRRGYHSPSKELRSVEDTTLPKQPSLCLQKNVLAKYWSLFQYRQEPLQIRERRKVAI